jgi:hypothetical protein
MHAKDALQDAERLLRRIARLLAATGRDDRVPPDVGRRLAARGLRDSDELGSQVGDAIDLVVVERVVLGIHDVPEDVVVLGGPAPFGASAVVVRPDDLVHEPVPTEDLVEENLAVVDLAVVEVHEERSARLQHPPGLDQARLEEARQVVEAIEERIAR